MSSWFVSDSRLTELQSCVGDAGPTERGASL